MTHIIPFDFDGAAVRVLEQDGEPWFVAGDVSSILGYSEAKDMTRNLDDDEKGRQIVPTPGGDQEMTTISESGLYSAILTSRRPEARRFKKWVTSEVLPSIRKTGSFAAKAKPPQLPATVSALLAIGKAVSKVPGVKPEMAMALTLNLIERTTGLLVSDMRLALPGAAQAEAKKLNPTQLGAAIGGLHARAINVALTELGFQEKTERGYVLTEAGAKLGEMTPFNRHGHSGYQPLWYESTIEVLRTHFSNRANVVPIGALASDT